MVTPALGGVEAYVFNHYKYMDREKFQFDFMTRNPGLKSAPQYQSFRYGVRLLPAAAAQDRERFAACVRKILRDGYDAVHLHTNYWTGYLIEELAVEAGVRRVIVHSHSTFIDDPCDKKREELLLRHEKLKREFPPELATDFWACSRTAADWLFGEQIPRKSIKIMANAIELDRYQFNKQAREAVRAKLGLSGSLVLGTVGRLSYTKNHPFLLEVFARFRETHQNARLLILGDGELGEELEERIREKNLGAAVLLPGWKTNVEDYLQAMDYFLLPSRFEGLPISVLEAVASGLPCIVSAQVTEEIEISSQIQRVPLDISAWISALEKRLDEPVARQDGAEIVRAAGYDVRQQAKVLERLYQA